MKNFFVRSRQEEEAQAELQFHVEKETEKNVAAGMPPDEARRQALIAFGGLAQTKESLREVHRGRFWESLFQDLRYGWRMLRKTPAFTAIAVLTLGLGIGANTAIFSLIDAVLFRSLPIRDPQGLVVFQWQGRQGPETRSYRTFGECDDDIDGKNSHPFGCSLPLPFFKQVQAQTGVFSHVAAFSGGEQFDLSGNGPAKMVRGEFVSGDYFETLGVRPHMGRLLTASDDASEASPVAVLNYGFWQTAFGGSPSAVGKTIRLNGVSFLIVGIAEPRFEALTLANKYDVWVPLAQRPHLVPRWNAKRDLMDSWWLIIVGRTRPGVAVTQAQEAVSLSFRDDVFKGVTKPIFKAEQDPKIRLASAARELGGSQKDILQPLYVLMLCVGVVLLIACANVAGLLLARSAARQREIAVRLALGAKRGRIVLQLLTESLMLAAAGGALGLLLAVWGARALMLMVSRAGVPQNFSPQLDWRVLAFTSGVSLVTGILFGLAPAFRGSSAGLTSALKSADAVAAAGPQGRRRFTLRGSLVVVQMALAVVVLVTAGLLVRTLNNLKNLNPGFNAHSLLIFGVDPRLAGYKGAQVDDLYRDLQQKFSALPGVTAASYSQSPLLSGSLSTTSFHPPGTPPTSKEAVQADEMAISPHFFMTLQVPFLAGHDFTQADFIVAAANAGEEQGSVPTPAIVNQAFVRNYFRQSNPLGQTFGDTAPTETGEFRSPGYQIVGIVSDTKYSSLRRDIQPAFYVPNVGGQAFFELRTATDPTTLIATVTNLVNHENQDLALFRMSTQEQAIDRQVFIERITAQLSSFFGLLALVLACLGLYGLLSYEVARRTREIGIRMAVGAQSHDVIGLVLLKAAALIAGGAMIGMGAALAVTRVLTSFLYGVKAGDPVTLVVVAALLAVVALAACYLPAYRATRVDPLVALRYE